MVHMPSPITTKNFASKDDERRDHGPEFVGAEDDVALALITYRRLPRQ